MGEAKRKKDLEKEEIRDFASHARTGDIIHLESAKKQEEKLFFHSDPNFIGMIEIHLFKDGKIKVANTKDTLLCLKMLDEARKVVKQERTADMVRITPINEMIIGEPLSVVEIHYWKDGKIRMAMPAFGNLTMVMLAEARKVIMNQRDAEKQIIVEPIAAVRS